jgi:hypothetical protein
MWLRRGVVTLLVVMVLSSLGGQTAEAQNSQVFNVPAGGRATITFEGYCLDFGGAFPTGLQAPRGLASNDVRGGLGFIANNGFSGQAKAIQGQYGLWRLAGVTVSPKGDATADAVVAAKGTVPANPANATSILDAAANGRASLNTTAWGPIGKPVEITAGSTDNFYGRGQLVVRNLTQQQLTLFMPIGTIFPPAIAGSQRIVAFPTAVQVVSGSLPNTAAIDSRPLAALLAVCLALPIHAWRKRRERLIGTRRAA